ncbi:alpha/beta fold hydrolase [Ottowia thiooxydans]|uniref:alpha/beta fold hydrolase n=1 Tax=Ottowia thiooxydans TaxID=219182 RepID=UPI00146BD8EF|nr:alpha/beta fold hydrolase [Ottowia thiooxydans]
MASTLSYTLQNEGSGPLIVLSHALGMDRNAWAPLLAHLGPRVRTLIFDHPGHGGSPGQPLAGTMNALVDEAAALLRDVARGPVVWVGLSMGGMVGMGLAIRHPALLQGLVVANSTAYYPDAARPNWDSRIATVRNEGLAAIADTVMQRYFHDDFRNSHPDAVARARATLVGTSPVAYAACCEAVRDVDWRAGLPTITIPTLVIAGSLDAGTPPAMGQAIAEAVPGAELTILPQASHISAVEQPAAFARLLRAFVRDRCQPQATEAADTSATDYTQGLQHRRRILGDAWVDRSLANRTDFNSEFQELITRHAWNDIWGRPALGDRLRRFMVLSMMIGIHAWDEFALHVRAALDGQEDSRLTPEDLKEVVLMAAIYCGVPAANHATGIVGALLREREQSPP